MLQLKLSLLLAFIYQFSFGQTINAVIFKDGTKEKLPYVSIGIKNKPKGTISDLDGKFTLNANSDDTLIFSSVGYKQFVVPASKVGAAVYLQEDAKELDEVVVKSDSKLRTAEIGNIKAKRTMLFGGTNQYAMLLKSDIADNAVLDELYFNLNPDIFEDNRWESTVKIRVYANDNGRPGKDLLTQNLVLQLNKKQKKLKVDVTNYAITIPREGVFIGFDFMGYLDNNNNFVPYSRDNRPLNLRVEFTEAQPDKVSLIKFFGTDWYPVYYPDKAGVKTQASAKFGAKVSY
ncbi:MAG TPA: carboxypeptidase-like regulatory domain-containing protein [Pontibacter sp.]